MPGFLDLYSKAYDFTLRHHPSDLAWVEDLIPERCRNPAAAYTEYLYVLYHELYQAVPGQWWEGLLSAFWDGNPYAVEHVNTRRSLLIVANPMAHACAVKVAEMIRRLPRFEDAYTAYFSSEAAVSALPGMGGSKGIWLARNLGHDVILPDLNTSALARAYGFRNAKGMVKSLSEGLGDRIMVVDFCLRLYLSHEHGQVKPCCEGRIERRNQ